MKFWKLTSVLFVGAFAALTMVFFTRKPQIIINADTYIDEQMQKIGKIKQKGQGNQQEVEVVLEHPKRKELRKTKQESRKAKRMARKTERIASKVKA